MVRVSGRVTDAIRVRVRHPDSSGNLLIRRSSVQYPAMGMALYRWGVKLTTLLCGKLTTVPLTIPR